MLPLPHFQPYFIMIIPPHNYLIRILVYFKVYPIFSSYLGLLSTNWKDPTQHSLRSGELLFEASHAKEIRVRLTSLQTPDI